MKLRDLIEFIRENRGRAAQMDDRYLLPYLLFHYKHGAVKVIEDDGKVTGFAVGRRTRTKPVDGNFSWGQYYEDGDHFIIGDIIATTPSAMRELAGYFLQRWPSVKHIYGHDRNGKVKPLSREFIRRLGNVDKSQSTPAKGHLSGDSGLPTGTDRDKAGAVSQ